MIHGLKTKTALNIVGIKIYKTIVKKLELWHHKLIPLLKENI